MVRFVIAIACVSVLFPATTAFGQARQSGAKTAPAGNRAPAPTAGKSKLPSTPVRQVSRPQPADSPVVPADGTAPADDAAPAGEASGGSNSGKAQIEMENSILNQQAPPMPPEMVKELDHLLQSWSNESDRIQRLEGKHFRIVYDTAFEVEKQSEGEFAYEKADKGRIDITPVQVTQELTEARAKEAEAAHLAKRRSQVRLKADGTPYDLVMEQAERWSCDGQRVYSVDVEKKQAVVAQLPADMQGKNIMDSPLPFLFGMPPEKAKRRFTIFFTGAKFDPNSGRAYLTAYPRLPQDAQTWRQADVILDLKELLPVAVQLLDPAGTKITVYKFRELQKNKKTLPVFLGGNPKTHFTPDLRDFQVQVVGGESSEENMKLANVSGLNHEDAIKQLERQGLKRVKGDKEANQIILEAGPPASKPAEIYTVKAQDPPPGTPIEPGMKVKLTILTDPKTAQK